MVVVSAMKKTSFQRMGDQWFNPGATLSGSIAPSRAPNFGFL
ncbi:hypothetical protein LZ3411_2145 [Levilactobacillus zymae]|uniref:Uncharacterized protein n=1 Tax=Levilactobacillus zymae TaxID=267363 RepID=A0A1Y6JZA1_9LACO|nr:hypothetical protein LZ3411_2145 [Levilactobacillus zymae]